MSVEYIGEEYNKVDEDDSLFSIDRFLEPGENIVYDTGIVEEQVVDRKIGAKISGSFVIVWCIIDFYVLGLVILAFISGVLEPQYTVFVGVFYTFHLLPLWIWIAQTINQVKNKVKDDTRGVKVRYVITSSRLLIKHARTIEKIYLSEIEVIRNNPSYKKDLTKIDMVYYRRTNNTQYGYGSERAIKSIYKFDGNKEFCEKLIRYVE